MIYRDLLTDNYAQNFGMQWNQFRKTQLDSFIIQQSHLIGFGMRLAGHQKV